MKPKLVILAAVLVLAVAAGALHHAYPIQVSIFGGLARNYLLSLFSPPGATITELNARIIGIDEGAVCGLATASVRGLWPIRPGPA